VRITPDTVVFNSARAFRDIYDTKANVSRSKLYRAFQEGPRDVNTVNTDDYALHHKKRRLLNLVFTDKAVRAAGTFIKKHVDRWNQLLLATSPEAGEEWSPPRDMSSWFSCLTFDILGDLCFGSSFETKEPGVNPIRSIPDAILELFIFTHIVSGLSCSTDCASIVDSLQIMYSPFLDLVIWLKPRGWSRLLEAFAPPAIKFYTDFVAESVSRRVKVESETPSKTGSEQASRRDMLHFLIHAKDPDTGLPAYPGTELLSEAQLLVIAGTGTMSTSLCGLFFYITRNESAYHRLVEEIRETFQSPEEILSGPKLSSCRYLRACLDEAMRLTPAAPSELPRNILPGGQVIDGEFYPAGTTVGTAMWSSGFSKDYGDSVRFRPERWIPDERSGVTPAEVARIKTISNPFSAGPMNCVGQNLAMLEMSMIVAQTLHRLDVRAEPGSTVGEGNARLGWGRRDEGVFQVRDAFTTIHDGPMVQFRTRRSWKS
jgi:cytochrome P450